MTTFEAFAKLISQRNWYAGTAIKYSTAADMKRRFLDRSITLKKMDEVLEKCGYKRAGPDCWL